MPWKPNDASSKTKKADTPSERKTWSKVANETLKRTGDDSRAIRTANAVVARNEKKGRR